MRTLTLRSCVPPTGRISPSCTTRRSFDWSESGISVDLVEEERPAVGDLEEPLLLLVRAREAPLLVTEQLALEQVLGHRGAVLPDEELVAAARAVVHGGGDELLAHARLPLDEHRHLRVDDLVELRDEGAHRARSCPMISGWPLAARPA